MNQAKLYQSAGFSEEEILKELQKDSPKAKVQVLDRQYKTAKENGIYYYFQYVPYLFLVISCYILGNLRMSFRKGDLPKRLAASAECQKTVVGKYRSSSGDGDSSVGNLYRSTLCDLWGKDGDDQA